MKRVQNQSKKKEKAGALKPTYSEKEASALKAMLDKSSKRLKKNHGVEKRQKKKD